MKVFIEKTQEQRELPFIGTAGQLLKKLDIPAENVLIVRDGELITEKDELSEGVQEVKLLSVISGG